MYLSDMHTHSIASGHGTECTITNMARAAAEKGLRPLGITDHGPALLQPELPPISAALPILLKNISVWNYSTELN